MIIMSVAKQSWSCMWIVHWNNNLWVDMSLPTHQQQSMGSRHVAPNTSTTIYGQTYRSEHINNNLWVVDMSLPTHQQQSMGRHIAPNTSTTIYGQTCRSQHINNILWVDMSLRTHHSDFEIASIRSYALMLHAERRSNKNQEDPHIVRTHDIPHWMLICRVTIIPPWRFTIDLCLFV